MGMTFWATSSRAHEARRAGARGSGSRRSPAASRTCGRSPGCSPCRSGTGPRTRAAPRAPTNGAGASRLAQPQGTSSAGRAGERQPAEQRRQPDHARAVGLPKPPGGSREQQGHLRAPSPRSPNARAPAERHEASGDQQQRRRPRRGGRAPLGRGRRRIGEVVEAPAGQQRQASMARMIRRVLCPELNTGRRVTICMTGGIPITTANQRPPNSATATRSAAAPQDQRGRRQHQRQRPDVHGALEQDRPDRRLGRAAPVVGHEDARARPWRGRCTSTDSPARSCESADSQSSSPNGTRLTAASAAPRASAPAKASSRPRPRGVARRGAPARGAAARNAAAQQRVEARLRVTGEELERHQRRQPARP